MTKELDSLVKRLSKKYGTLRIASENIGVLELLSTGNLALDLCLEGGIPMGQVVEWSGKSGSGKSLMLQIVLKDFQKKYPDGICIWFDRESAFSEKRAVELGIDLNKVILVKPQDIPTVPEAEILLISILEDLSKDLYKFIAVDSISAFAEDSDPLKSDMGRKSKTLHHLFRRVLPYINNKVSFHFANQITFRVGVMFGDNTTVTSGESVKYYSSTRIKVDDKRHIIDSDKGNEILGNWIKATVIKTRNGPSFRSAIFPFLYQTGIDYYGGYARLLVDRGYLHPNNKAEFDKFVQNTFSYKDAKRLSEFEIETIVKQYPELLFHTYPEYNKEKVTEIESELG